MSRRKGGGDGGWVDVGRGIFSDNLHVVGQSIIMHMMHVCIDCLAHLIIIAFDISMLHGSAPVSM